MRIPLPGPLPVLGRPKAAVPPKLPKLAFGPILAEKPEKRAPKLPAATPTIGASSALPNAVPTEVPSSPASPRGPERRVDHGEPDETLELDPAARMVAQLAPPPSVAPSITGAAPPPPGAPSIDPHLASELVERAAFWGDGTRGLARLRFGGKARAGLSGATVTLEHDGEVLRLRVDEAEDPELAARLRERLSARGLNVKE